MEESFLHYIWRFQKFDKSALQTTDGESIEVIKPGNYNTDSGPDFLNSKIIINDLTWFGHVEIHTDASDWNAHSHQKDPAYENVILHVVFRNNKKMVRNDNSPLPVLELCDRIDMELYGSYQALISSIAPIPCAFHVENIEDTLKYSMLDRVTIERLQRKAGQALELLKSNNNDWEETAYQLLAKNFGFKINSEAFYELARIAPLKIIKKHANNLLQIEAMLFGLGNMLPKKGEDEYSINLKKEYCFLSKKFGFEDTALNPGRWKFLRLRPANFPTLRIAQFAQVLHKGEAIFSTLLEINSMQHALSFFDVEQSSYWQKHYNFFKCAPYPIPGLGKEAIGNIILNTLCPLLAAYSLEKDNKKYLERAISLLEDLPPEKNKITSLLSKVGFNLKNGFDSQAAIELYNSYCSQRKCLSCTIGSSLIKL